jgi:hypothetical protein
MRTMRTAMVLLVVGGGAFALIGCGNGNGMGEDDLTMSPKPDLTMTGGGPDGLSQDLSMADLSMDMSAAMDDMAGGDIAMWGGGDLAGPTDGPPPCQNTPQNCGTPGACVDCTNSANGHQCVTNACGCNSEADCPAGNACNPNTHLCQTACANNLPCNGGCCDGMSCVAGTDNAKCGATGGACAACADGTPTCTNGACTATCVVKGQQGGVCGNGFCCNAMNQCTAIGNGACALAGEACVDCAMSMNGKVCAMGVCGCGAAADCPMGQACTNGKCGTACSKGSLCNGGCCAAGMCVGGAAGAACGGNGDACVDCTNANAGHACVNGVCGCAAAADCPAGQACTNGKCGAACDMNTPCNGGCCTAAMNGMCVAGTAQATCGNNGGLCLNCMTQFQQGKAGVTCEAVMGGGQCGCTMNNECPNNAAGCLMNTKLCNFMCSMQAPCQAGCCANGGCQPGTSNTACGANGSCVDCTMSNTGHVCRANLTCGCNTAADCPMGMACTNNVCSANCDLAHPCNGGCCSAGIAGMCVAGNAANACGALGGVCANCTMNAAGHACVAGACGCAAAVDCPAQTACNTMTKKCENVCGDNNHTACSGGCCQNMACVPGTSNSACGGNGNACVACKDGTPSCVMNACTDACGGNGNGTCANGFCCSNLKCVNGTMDASCGFQGVCANCSANSNGSKCLMINNTTYTCGCNVAADCPKANPQLNQSGSACDTTSKTCTTVCGVLGVTACNGGCCSGANGQCRPGNADLQCGVSGGYCTNCNSSCNPGPHCNANNGTCGCSAVGQCNNVASCTANGANRYGCNYGNNQCCIPGVLNFTNNGSDANCCTGKSYMGNGMGTTPCPNGASCCTCVPPGSASGGDPWNCCTILENNGTCGCIANNMNSNNNAWQCCSNHQNFGFCAAAQNGQTCYTTAGCQFGLTCRNINANTGLGTCAP